MMFEGTQQPDTIGLGPGFIKPVGYQSLPGGDDKANLHALNDHTYCCQMNAEACATGEAPLSLKDDCQSWHERRLIQRSLDAERLHVPLIISEFGACGNSVECAMEIGLVTEACDKHLTSWAYWQYLNGG